MEYYKNLDLQDIIYFCEFDLIWKTEQWKPVLGYEGIYKVSDLGRVKSLSRKKMNGISSFHFTKEIILKNVIQKDGYNSVGLLKLGKLKIRKNHQLVAVAFLNHIPCGYEKVVNHKNFIKTDNRKLNLEIVTARENSNRKHIKNTSEYVGVSWHKSSKKWASTIGIKKQTIYLGIFENEIDAHNAYQNALKNLTNS